MTKVNKGLSLKEPKSVAQLYYDWLDIVVDLNKALNKKQIKAMPIYVEFTRPYANACRFLGNIEDSYGADSAKEILLRFRSNLGTARDSAYTGNQVKSLKRNIDYWLNS